VDDYVGAGVLEETRDIDGGAGSLGDDLREVLAQAIMGHAASDLDANLGDLGKLIGVVGARKNGLPKILAHLGRVNINGRGEFDVGDVVAAQVDMHQPGDEVGLGGVSVVFDALDQRRGAVAHADDRYTHLVFAHPGVPP